MAVQEGLDLLLNVANTIRNRGRDDVHFVCVGGGPELEELRDLCRQMNLQDSVDFPGRVSDADLLEILSTADVCVNPDRVNEMNDMSTMIKIMEYMALEKPIVQFDLKEGRFSAQDAALYAEDSIEDFADKILCLLDDPDQRSRMGAFGKRRVLEELAWQHSVPKLLSAYSQVLGPERS
jgi:glycosyltransferase involved in cell wall biosynthesis